MRALMFGLIFAVLMAVSAIAAPLPVTVDSVKIDSETLDAGLTTVRQLERGEDFTVSVKLSATANAKDVQINAFVSGFEHSRSQPISDSVRPFDLAAGENVVKKLKLSLPERADEDRYLIRVVVSDRSSDSVVREYGIKIEPSDAQVVISDFEISPEDEVQAGSAVLATVRVKNLGDSRENDLKVKVSIPDLGVSANADFIDELDEDESATSEEFFLRINRCTKPGIYEVLAEVEFDEGDEKVTAAKVLTVTEGICEAVAEPGRAEVTGKTTIAYSTEAQSLVAGGSSASYPITITNSGTSARAFVLSVDSGAEWADFRLSPGNLVTVKPGTTQTVYVVASAKQGVAAGERVFTVSVKNSAGEVLQTLALKADVAAGAGVAGVSANLRNALTAGLVVVLAVLVVVGLVLAFRRKGGEEESQTYY
ncbi:hypothetical protein HYX10_06565 [Candidatus Woesearchaeota archaeon]|nr:hypothetical protein [Candidatus Woesearchaeota archaeon]